MSETGPIQGLIPGTILGTPVENILAIGAIALASFAVSYVTTWYIVRKKDVTRMTGKDMHKQDRPEVPEMGGFGPIAGILAGLFVALFINTFALQFFDQNMMIAGVCVVLTAAIIGAFDDIFDLPQWMKAIMPLFIAAPIIALQAFGSTEMYVPMIGTVDFGIAYIFLMVPLAITVCSNLTNMLAGFNGLEAGLTSVIFAGLAAIGLMGNNPLLYLPSLAALFANLAFMRFNWYPARVFPGDTGTFTWGAVIASSVIIGNLESAGAMMLILYYADFVIKILNRFPKSFAELRDGKLHAPGKPRGLVDIVLKLGKGMREKDLVITLIQAQVVITIAVVLVFASATL